jgi:putative phosphoribosyl transferase
MLQSTETGHELREIRVPVPGGLITGDLSLPARARGIVIFAHGSGSSRLSRRNRWVARQLESLSLATLLFDLLTPEEEVLDARNAALRFDIPFLARRLVHVTDLVREEVVGPGLPLGYFGASTGAAAALIAATQQQAVIRAVVSRGGQPDLAAAALREVRAPTLLIVGGADREVLALNQAALAQLTCPRNLRVVPRATHLFEEPGALEEVARLAGEWFARYLV